jgi:hypothetical protein
VTDFLIVAGIFLALGVISVYLWRQLPDDVQGDWKTFAEQMGAEFEATGTGRGEMSVTGSPFGTPMRMWTKYLHAGDTRQVQANLDVPVPGQRTDGLTIKASMGPRKVMARRKAEDPHAPDLPLVWKATGVDDRVIEALQADRAVRQRMTNLLLGFPHAQVREGLIHVDALFEFGAETVVLVELASLLALDIARVVDETA